MTPPFFPVPFLDDNYGWLVVCPLTGACAVVDPYDAQTVLSRLQTLTLPDSPARHASAHALPVPLPPPGQRTLAAVFCTHHHWDHTHGIPALLEKFPGIPVYGHVSEQQRISGLTHPVAHRDPLRLGSCAAHVLHVPGHTRGAVAYAFDGVVFTGDTLFAGGCGRLFEGSADEMHGSLEALAALPPGTQVACGHEYTLSNLEFAAWLEPENPYTVERLAAARLLRRLGKPTVPSPLWLEHLTNPFLRVKSRQLRRALSQKLGGSPDLPSHVLAEVRRLKDQFRPSTHLLGRLTLVGDV